MLNSVLGRWRSIKRRERKARRRQKGRACEPIEYGSPGGYYAVRSNIPVRSSELSPAHIGRHAPDDLAKLRLPQGRLREPLHGPRCQGSRRNNAAQSSVDRIVSQPDISRGRRRPGFRARAPGSFVQPAQLGGARQRARRGGGSPMRRTFAGVRSIGEFPAAQQAFRFPTAPE